MINEFDISDWQMLTEPLELKELKAHDLFSFDGVDCVFKYLLNSGERIIAVFNEDENLADTFLFPDFLKVYKWQKLV